MCSEHTFQRSSASNTPINDGAWHFATGTYDGSRQKLFVDGVLENEDPQSGSIADSDKLVCIGGFCDGTGGRGSTGEKFPGLIDEIAIYNRGLPQEVVKNNYCALEAMVGSDLAANGCLP